MTRSAPFALFLVLVSGFVLWSVAFVAIYAGHATACEMLAPPGPDAYRSLVARITAGTAWLLHLAAHTALVLWIWKKFPKEGAEGSIPLLRISALALAIAAGAATFATGVPILLVEGCR